ncbi:glycerate kinase [bacterium]|nr:glycerate kinase [bacterium]MBU1065088.1 glycerate kinase [bacterium]MBU1635821.1 glycerate kinase [bacterium]MBU1875373.1 glycerate kinase [bacterium]
MMNYRKKIVIAPDSFKGSLTSQQVCESLAKGIWSVSPDTNIQMLPLSDGGEGFLSVFRQIMSGELISVDVLGPLGEPVDANYFVLKADNVAIIEMAEAAGLIRVPMEKRNPFKTTTYGLGQLIRHALDGGIRKFVIGIGGSATTDAGAGMAQALGVKFYDEDGVEIQGFMNGELIGRCRDMRINNIHPAIVSSDFRIACDVDNPLLGPDGAVYTYSQQKGASPDDLPILERNMTAFNHVIESQFNRKFSDIAGAGAAGGLGAGLMAFLNARLESGIDLILDTVQINRMLDGCDLVITGEGKIDRQTLQGKVVTGVSKRARQYSIPVIGVTGKLELDPGAIGKLGLERVFSLTDECGDERMAMENAQQLLVELGKRILDSHFGKN